MIPVRDDLRALEGYHSPQVDVRVRLNTNESPAPPPTAWRDAFAAELSRVEWHRYPDRAATALRTAIADWHGVDPAQVFAANGSNEVIQTAAAHVRRSRPHRRHVRADVPAARSHRAHHRLDRRRGGAVRRLHARPGRGAPGHDRGATRTSCSCAHPTTRPVSSNRPSGCTSCSSIAPGLVVVDEAYAQFADWSALPLVAEDRPLVVVRTFSKTWSMAASRLGYLVGPAWLVAELDKVVLPYHLDAAKQIAGRLALRFVDDMDERVKHDRRRARAHQRGDGGDGDRRRAERRQLRAVPAAPSDGSTMSGRGSSTAACWCATARGGRGSTDCLRVTVGTPAENDAFLDALAEVARVSRTATRSRATKETTIDIAIDLDGSGTTDVSTGIPFYDHMLDQLGRHSGFDLIGRAPSAISTSTRTTRSRTPRSRSARRSVKRSATRPVCAGSRAAGSRSTRR